MTTLKAKKIDQAIIAELEPFGDDDQVWQDLVTKTIVVLPASSEDLPFPASRCIDAGNVSDIRDKFAK